METAAHILIVDDHQEIRDLLGRFLERHGFRSTACRDGAEMRRALEAARFDLIVLDLMLPGDDGLKLCRELRSPEAGNPDIPIIMLTAMSEETDRIVGLEVGADDYLPKPFNPENSSPASGPFFAARPALTPTSSRHRMSTVFPDGLWTSSGGS